MTEIVVDSVLWAGGFGGAIFSGTAEDGRRHRMVSRYEVMPRPPVVGETWSVEGVVENHPQYGRQVVTSKALLVRPSGRLLVKALAKSADFPGIGEKLAGHLWRRFGEDLYAMLEAGDPAPLEAPLRSPWLARVVVEGWRGQSQLADVYRWLDCHGAPLRLAEKVVNIYAEHAVAKLEENPYRLLAFSSWETVDPIARSMGIGLGDDRRLVAAADWAVMQKLASSHTWMTESDLRAVVKDVLHCLPALSARAMEVALAEGALVAVQGGVQGLGPAAMEEFLANMIVAMRSGKFQAAQMTLRPALEPGFTSLPAGPGAGGLILNDGQQRAVSMAQNEPVMILCGGAGVGKTATLKAICDAAGKVARRVHLVALTGRAARRMAEATGCDALTIASFINKVSRGKITLDDEPLIAIDEASMLDLPIAYRLFRPLEPGCRLLLIGDPGQLPPISFGLVFHTLVECGALPMVQLTEVHRQAAATGIPQVAALVGQGTVPQLDDYAGRGVGVQFIDCRREEIPDRLPGIVAELGGFDEVQILSAVKNGVAGTRDINYRFHRAHLGGTILDDVGFAAGERVVWIENDYRLELMNGALGKVLQQQDDGLRIAWDDRERVIEDVTRMEHAYAITIHKSQGSQFPRVIIPVFQCRPLDRTLIYTAVTRAELQVVLIGERAAFRKAVTDPPGSSLRRTGLRFALARAAVGQTEDFIENKGGCHG